MKHPRRHRARAVTLAAALLVVGPLALYATPTAEAQIYKYEDDRGNVLYTTEPQDGLELIEVIGDEAPTAASSSSSTRSAAPREPGRPNPNPERTPDVFDELIEEAADAYQIPFEFIKAVIRVESAFDPHAVSHAGAMGLMQLMPATAASLNCEDPFDPRQNIMAGTQFLRILTNRYNGDINLILSAYNAGSGAVARYDGIPFEATRRYIERVYQYYHEYLGEALAELE